LHLVVQHAFPPRQLSPGTVAGRGNTQINDSAANSCTACCRRELHGGSVGRSLRRKARRAGERVPVAQLLQRPPGCPGFRVQEIAFSTALQRSRLPISLRDFVWNLFRPACCHLVPIWFAAWDCDLANHLLPCRPTCRWVSSWVGFTRQRGSPRRSCSA